MLLLTDVFPPKSGGSGWSTFYLGKALAERGHSVRVLRPDWDKSASKAGLRADEYEGMPVEWVTLPAAPMWAKKAGLAKAWRERAAARLMARRAGALALAGKADVLHGQHKASAGAASVAAQQARTKGVRVVSVATVRDYWPLCPVSTRLFTDQYGESFECDECHALRAYLECASAGGGSRLGRLMAVARWVGTLRASRLLAGCDATIAVSGYVRGQLAKSGRVADTKLVSIPNLVHLPSVEASMSSEWPLADISPEQPFLLFVGKLDMNKGMQYLAGPLQYSGVDLPVVFAGDGPMRGMLEESARDLGLDFRFYDWLENDAILRLMKTARLLLFPSAWQEPLSRVLLEGCAAGAAIVAMNTGGTPDIIVHGESGWLASDAAGFTVGIRAVASDEELNRKFRAGARRQAETVFASTRVATEVEGLYERLLAGVGVMEKGK
ncbi:MAG: glycosyltransferase family 4 protein [Chloroflexia bacterium]